MSWVALLTFTGEPSGCPAARGELCPLSRLTYTKALEIAVGKRSEQTKTSFRPQFKLNTVQVFFLGKIITPEPGINRSVGSRQPSGNHCPSLMF